MNLVEAVQSEIKRVTEIIIEYRSIPGGAGNLGAALMQRDVDEAIRLLASSEAVELIGIYKKLQEWYL